MSVVLDWSLALSLIWPLTFVAGAWAVAVWALTQRDAQSELISRLTEPRPELGQARSASDVLRTSPPTRKEAP